MRLGQWTKAFRLDGCSIAYRPITRRGAVLAHTCEDCGEPINRGDFFYVRSERPSFQESRHCLECSDIRVYLETGYPVKEFCEKSYLEAQVIS